MGTLSLCTVEARKSWIANALGAIAYAVVVAVVWTHGSGARGPIPLWMAKTHTLFAKSMIVAVFLAVTL